MSTSRDAAPPGTQTLVRGLSILEAVGQSRDGITVQQAAELVGIHRTMAMRALDALAEFNLVRRGSDGRFRIAGGVLGLARDYQPDLRDASRPILEQLAKTLGMSACLFVVDGDAAVASLVVEPGDASFHLTFRTGSRHPLDRGSVAYAIAMLREPSESDLPDVVAAREAGYARSHGLIENGAWGVAAPLDLATAGTEACILAVSAQEALADRAPSFVIAAARDIEATLGLTPPSAKTRKPLP